jgi:hypothetical protein
VILVVSIVVMLRRRRIASSSGGAHVVDQSAPAVVPRPREPDHAGAGRMRRGDTVLRPRPGVGAEPAASPVSTASAPEPQSSHREAPFDAGRDRSGATCTRCGSRTDPGHTFCGHCGQRLG